MPRRCPSWMNCSALVVYSKLDAALVDPRGSRLSQVACQPGEGAGALHPADNQVGPPLDPELAQQVGDVELHCALGDEQLAGDLFVGKVVEQQVEDFAFAATDVHLAVERLAAAQLRKDGFHKAGEQFAAPNTFRRQPGGPREPVRAAPADRSADLSRPAATGER